MRQDHPDIYQTRLDGPSILDLDLDLSCRHEMVPVLRGLQAIYADDAARTSILDLVRKDVLGSSSSRRGRRGLDLWQILVLAAVRLGLNLDYDALHDLAENHHNLRTMMGLGPWNRHLGLNWRRIRDAVCSLAPETVIRISDQVVRIGHRLLGTRPTTVRLDSFVMRTNIHFPSDIRQTGDALRCLVRHGARLAEVVGSSRLRQHRHLQRRIRSLVLTASRALGCKGKNREQRRTSAVRDLVVFAKERCDQMLGLLDEAHGAMVSLDVKARAQAEAERSRVFYFLSALDMVAEVARRHHLDGETVPLVDKLFSVFEAHTEMIVRGKVPIPYEFGHRCLVAEDEQGFILHAHVMANGRQDRDVVPTIARLLRRRHSSIDTMSFDRGFHSPENQQRLAELVPHPCLPTTGVQAAAQQTAQADAAWRQARQRHPGIESAIGALQAGNGCVRCRDRTRIGYHRYLALAVLGRNLHTLGRLLIAQESPEALAGLSRRTTAA